MALISVVLTACSDDDDFADSIFDLTEPELSELDLWLENNFRKPYNVRVLYKWKDFETNQVLKLVPAKEEKVIPFLEIIQQAWMNPYVELGGVDFFARTSPKQIMLIGSSGYLEDGMYLLGEAEQGNRITIYGVNTLDVDTDKELLVRHARTFHHEFVHILNQLVKFSPAFEELSADKYTLNWTQMSNYWEEGFVSQYAAENANEDFAEMVASFLFMDQDNWEALMGLNSILKEKETIMLQYMKNVWNIDMHKLRSRVLAEVSNIMKG